MITRAIVYLLAIVCMKKDSELPLSTRIFKWVALGSVGLWLANYAVSSVYTTWFGG